MAHATRSSDPATIVMPTGAGKTQTMLALNAHQRFERLPVVVPTDAQREQIAGKVETFGVPRQQQGLEDRAAFPVVMRLSHIATTVAEVDEIFDSANVIVTTMQIAGRAEAAVREQMAAHASALFIDETHHIAAQQFGHAASRRHADVRHPHELLRRSRGLSHPPSRAQRSRSSMAASALKGSASARPTC
ncbi:DEAD/DEAH box helicase family protein [Hoeflea sp.]|uniref:DEAD/DEAH box helicase family protein n=1 Tax=Hoeflea sp. TaxID=1940281 RepID=UPI003B02A27B